LGAHLPQSQDRVATGLDDEVAVLVLPPLMLPMTAGTGGKSAATHRGPIPVTRWH
jgi:hypothetical protein